MRKITLSVLVTAFTMICGSAIAFEPVFNFDENTCTNDEERQAFTSVVSRALEITNLCAETLRQRMTNIHFAPLHRACEIAEAAMAVDWAILLAKQRPPTCPEVQAAIESGIWAFQSEISK